MRATFALFEGPSVQAPFAAVMVEADCPVSRIPQDKLEGCLRQFLSPELIRHVTFPLRDGGFESVTAALANAFQDCAGANGLPVQAKRTAQGASCRILLGYIDPMAATLALQMALDVTAALFAQLAGRRVDTTSLTTRMRRTVDQIRARQPDPLARVLIGAARRRGIPVYPVASGSRVWLFGQGARGIHFFEVANHFDAMTGSRIAKNKFHSNQLIAGLGFPGVRHGLAPSPEAATRLAAEIGYPVVVKPLASGKGAGVTAYITREADVVAAFAEASRISRGDVLVERHVPGDDHRLVVIGGELAWAVRRSPPAVVGDGEHSIIELMDMENCRRAGLPAADIASGKLVLDAEMRAVLGSQDFGPEDRPAAGTRVILRHIANIARGGTLADCTASVHPEVRDMAEAIARSFHLDAMGLDFMTPDISRSWREVACAVLEVNATPGFSSEGRAEIILDAKFPGGGNGRVPAIVLVEMPPAAMERVVAAGEAAGRCVGRTDGRATFLGDRPRMQATAALPARVRALVMDAACEALVIAVTAAEIEGHGFPLARCDVAIVGNRVPVSEAMQRLIESCAQVVHPVGDDGDPGVAAMESIRVALASVVAP